MGVVVQLSHTKDGSMYNRQDPGDTRIIAHRRTWLADQSIDLSDTTRLYITYDDDNSYVKYTVLTAADKGKGMTGDDIEHADAIVTTEPGHALFLPVADCIATTFYDEEHGVLMLSHLGRQSLEQQGGVKSVEFLVEHFQTKPEQLQVWTSASINKDAYKIYKLDNAGMKESLYAQLEKAGVSKEQVIDDTSDTGTDDKYFSHSEYLKGNKPESGCHAMVAMMTK
jgi:copper oxidase (laccase) domain-containing protein